jgi:hypothetical protein
MHKDYALKVVYMCHIWFAYLDHLLSDLDLSILAFTNLTSCSSSTSYDRSHSTESVAVLMLLVSGSMPRAVVALPLPCVPLVLTASPDCILVAILRVSPGLLVAQFSTGLSRVLCVESTLTSGLPAV